MATSYKRENKSVRKLLRSDLCQAVFKKADGTKRKMVCTLHPTFLPPKMSDGPSLEALMRDPVQVVVWDIEALAFRSFRLDRLINLKTL